MNPAEKQKWAFLKNNEVVQVLECTLMQADEIALDWKQAGVIDSWTAYENVKNLCQATPATH